MPLFVMPAQHKNIAFVVMRRYAEPLLRSLQQSWVTSSHNGSLACSLSFTLPQWDAILRQESAASSSGRLQPSAMSSNHHTFCSSAAACSSEESISVTFVDKDGSQHTVQAPLGKNLLEVAHDNEIELEGACEGSLACSTCHLIVENEEYFKKLPEAVDDELDMLDLAFGLTETSRLGCQIIATKDIDGIRVRIPSASRNFYVDGHKPQPH